MSDDRFFSQFIRGDALVMFWIYLLFNQWLRTDAKQLREAGLSHIMLLH